MIKNGKPSWPVTTTLFHELGHITDENIREGILVKERLQDSSLDGGLFYEWTNTVFERLVSGKQFYRKDNAMQLSVSGYEALAPLGSMLACALGFSEIEFTKIKDKGRDYEEKLLEEMFPNTGENGNVYGSEVLKNVKEIFDKYELETDFSLKKKVSNQKLLNEMYVECIEIMKRRIENEMQINDTYDSEEYKKHQMFLLKKLNYNYKSASRSDGFMFLKSSIIHDIGVCTDQLSKEDLITIGKEFVAMADFGFDNSTLGKYNKSMTPSIEKQKSFLESVKVSDLKFTETKDNNHIVNNKEYSRNDKEKNYK